MFTFLLIDMSTVNNNVQTSVHVYCTLCTDTVYESKLGGNGEGYNHNVTKMNKNTKSSEKTRNYNKTHG